MGRIQVDIGGLRQAGGHAAAVGGDIAGLAGEAHSLGGGDGAPPATSAALEGLGSAGRGEIGGAASLS